MWFFLCHNWACSTPIQVQQMEINPRENEERNEQNVMNSESEVNVNGLKLNEMNEKQDDHSDMNSFSSPSLSPTKSTKKRKKSERDDEEVDIMLSNYQPVPEPPKVISFPLVGNAPLTFQLHFMNVCIFRHHILAFQFPQNVCGTLKRNLHLSQMLTAGHDNLVIRISESGHVVALRLFLPLTALPQSFMAERLASTQHLVEDKKSSLRFSADKNIREIFEFDKADPPAFRVSFFFSFFHK